MQKALISIDYTYDFVADDGKLTAGKPAQASSDALDEPSAGLDPAVRREIFAQIRRRYEEKGISVILVSHNMEDISSLANRSYNTYFWKTT